jgi:RNA polymerase sigma factor (sigma-70 family)
MWAVSDDALLAGMAAGDPEAGHAFVARFQRRIYGLAYSIMGDAAASQDVAQEALVRAWRHAGLFDARRGSVTSWLLAITRNLAIDSMRVRRPVAIDPDTILEMELPSSGRSPADAVVTLEETERLRAALARLPAEQQRAVVLAGLLGYTAREIAELELIPLGTAKTRIRTGLIRLRAALVSDGPPE